MASYEGETFEGIELCRAGVFEDASFERCVFERCAVRGGVGPYGTVRRVSARRCTYRGAQPFDTILDEVTIEDLSTGSAVLPVVNCLFRRVVLRGSFDRLFIHPTSRAQVNAVEFYRNVDWALDVREARFREIDIRGVPSALVRRDPDTQLVVKREDALKNDRWRKLPRRAWQTAIGDMTRNGGDESLLVPALRGESAEEDLASARMLKHLGLAR